MRRLPTLDRWLLAVLTPLWLLCVALHVDRQLMAQPLAWVPLYVSPAADGGHATVAGYWPETPAAEQQLEAGDVLVRIGDRDAAGIGFFAFWARMFEAAGGGLDVPVVAERDGRRFEATVPLRPMSLPWQTLVLSVPLGISALLAIARGRGSPMTRAYGLGALAYSFQWLFLFGGERRLTSLGLSLFLLAGAFYQPFTLRAALLFPENVAVRSKLPYALCWVFAITTAGLWMWIFGSPLSGAAGMQILSVSYGLWIVAFLAILALHYRKTDGRGRRQLRWVLYGFYVGLAPVLAGSLVMAARPDLREVYDLSRFATALIPFFIYIAFFRYQLYDINRLITSTLVGSVLVFAMAGAVGGLVPALAGLLSEAAGFDESSVRAVISVLLGGALLGVGVALYPRALGIFAPESQRLERAVREIRAEIGVENEPATLLRSTAERLGEALRLESCILYVRVGDHFDPAVVRGPVAEHRFGAAGPLASLLAGANGPVSIETRDGSAIDASIDAEERRVLAVAGTHLIVPIRRGVELTAFLCLGEKRSGDIYAAQDVNLLDGLADRMSLELTRFAHEELRGGQRDLSNAVVRLYSCFLSYATEDEAFARMLYRDLEAAGVRAWFAPESLRVGDRWQSAIDESLSRADKLLVVLSKDSLASHWVGYEVEAALRRDSGESRDRSMLFPLRIDDAVLEAESSWPARIRESVHIADFREWRDPERYAAALEKLLRDLGHSEPIEAAPEGARVLA